MIQEDFFKGFFQFINEIFLAIRNKYSYYTVSIVFILFNNNVFFFSIEDNLLDEKSKYFNYFWKQSVIEIA